MSNTQISEMRMEMENGSGNGNENENALRGAFASQTK